MQTLRAWLRAVAAVVTWLVLWVTAMGFLALLHLMTGRAVW